MPSTQPTQTQLTLTQPTQTAAVHTSVSRRGFFAGIGIAGAASVLASCMNTQDNDSTARTQPSTPTGQAAHNSIITFDGSHQAGIRTDPQSHALLIAYRLAAGHTTLRDLQRIMRIWTGDARNLTQGHTPLADLEPELAAAPRNLTITVGWGPQMIERLGLHPAVPGWVPAHRNGLPAFLGDQLTPEFSGGDLILQICGDDLTAISHAGRVLTRGCRDYAQPQWTQRGFLNSPTGQTPRNLLGFKDGTVRPRDDADYDEHIWDHLGGSAMVVRRVVYDMPNWEALDRSSREVVFGRTVVEGAPMNGTSEFDEVDLTAVDSNGLPLTDPNSHVGLMSGLGRSMRRRAYNWDGEVTELGSSGLVFICFQKDPAVAFTPMQTTLANNDRLNQWVTHVGSAVFWCPPGTQEGSYWGSSILEG